MRLTRPLLLLLLGLLALPAGAHFQELIPSQAILEGSHDRQLELELRFTHPMAGGPAMAMAAPIRFGVSTPSGSEDLLQTLEPRDHQGVQGFHARYRIRRPGDHLFYLQPAPYWEADEGKMIVHYTKVVVDAFAGPAGWDRLLGLPVEIEPLTRPYGLWSGNLFRGIVRHQGEPVPFAEVEVEWRNDGSVALPAAAFHTQVIKTDGNGVFSYAMPRSGWWGFAALVEGPPVPGPDGTPVPQELGGLIWVQTLNMGGEE